MRKILHRVIVTVAAGPLHTFACWLFKVADRIWWDDGEPVNESEDSLRKAWDEAEPVDIANTPLFIDGYSTNRTVGTVTWTVSGNEPPRP